MANIYVRNGAATPTSPFSTWATASANLVGATAIATPSDTIWIADDHTETQGAVTFACPTTPGLRILVAATHTIAPPTEISITASISSTGTITIHGYVYIYGLTINALGTGASSIRLGFVGGLQCGIIAENCTFYFGVTSAAQTLALGGINSGGVGATYIKLINPAVRFAATSHNIKADSGRVHIDGMWFDSSSATPTSLFTVGSNAGPSADFLIENSDLSDKTFTNLFTVASNVNPSNMVVQNCRIPGLLGWITGSLGAYGAQKLSVYNTDLLDSHINFREQDYAGTVETDTGTFRASGAQQADATDYSWKMTGTTNASMLYPLRSPELALWNTITALSQTATVEILRDNVTALKDNEIWLEVTYYYFSGYPLARTISDRIPTVISSPANQTASSVTWTNSMSNPNKQKLVVSFTALEVGYVKIRVCLGLNTTVYVDPFITKA